MRQQVVVVNGGCAMLATRWSVRGLSLWALTLILAMPPALAMADTTVFDDPVGDSTSVDISRVRVVHRDAVTVRVKSAVPLSAGQDYAFWIDVGGRAQPDYYVSFRANSGYDGELRTVHSFRLRRAGSVRCPRLRLRADMFTDEPVSMRIPRRCLENPRRVRVAVQFKDEIADTVDWAADRRTFGPWVRR